VGCDGLHSAVRKQLHPDEGEPVYSGVNCWRGRRAGPPFLTGASFVRAGGSRTASSSPIRSRNDRCRGRQLVNWVAEIETPHYKKRDWNRPGTSRISSAPSRLALRLARRARIPARRGRSCSSSRWSTRTRCRGGARARDAARRCGPSDGAARLERRGQAILDARALADGLASERDPAAALKAYEAQRHEATARIVLTNRTNPPDAILREVYCGRGPALSRASRRDQREELAGISDGYKRVAAMIRHPCHEASATFSAGVAATLRFPLFAQDAYPRRPFTSSCPSRVHGHRHPRARAGHEARRALECRSRGRETPRRERHIGTDAVAKAAAGRLHAPHDGEHDLLNRSLFRTIPYDPVKDFAPVLPLALGSMALVVHPSVKAKTVAEFVALAKAQPGRSTTARRQGHAAPPRDGALQERDRHRPRPRALQGQRPGGHGPLGGQIAVMFLPVHLRLPQVQCGKLRMLASAAWRAPSATPESPSLAEAAGIRDIDVDIWYALYAPAGRRATWSRS
jgi:hypothetical protein